MQTDGYKYQFQYTEDSLYAQVMRLVEKYLPTPSSNDELIVDIGCGWGAVAEQCRQLGFTYLGCDLLPEGLDNLKHRGFESMIVDISDIDTFASALKQQIGSRKVAAFFMLDVLEHLVNGDKLVAALSILAKECGGAHIIMSVPNIAHYELAAKLLMGRFDVTPTGLLDQTHVIFYTSERLTATMNAAGWKEVAKDDYIMYESDQRFPALAAPLAPNTPLREFLVNIRDTADDYAFINQFVRVYAPDDSYNALEETTGDRPVIDKKYFANQTFASILVRTTGSRIGTLHDTLLSLAAQTDQDFEVLLLCHNVPSNTFDMICELVNSFPESFSSRVNIVQVSGGGRSRPLNVGTKLAKGKYTIILDDDDLAFGCWMEEFHKLADHWPGQVLRLGVAVQHLEDQPGPGEYPSYHTISRPYCPYPKKFDLLSHLHENRTPPCALAYPTSLFQYLGIKFGEDLPVLEDWDVLVRATQLCGVANTTKVCALYRHWKSGDQSTSVHPPAQWMDTRKKILSTIESLPILLPPKYMNDIRKINDLEQVVKSLHIERSRLMASLSRLHVNSNGETLSADPHTAALIASAVANLDARQKEREQLENSPGDTPQHIGYESWLEVASAFAAELIQIKSSKGWKLTEPLRTAGRWARRLTGNLPRE